MPLDQLRDRFVVLHRPRRMQQLPAAAALCGGGGQGDAMIVRVPKA